jgi:hypothetical protein
MTVRRVIDMIHCVCDAEIRTAAIVNFLTVQRAAPDTAIEYLGVAAVNHSLRLPGADHFPTPLACHSSQIPHFRRPQSGHDG